MCSFDFASLPGAETRENIKNGLQAAVRLNRADEEDPAYIAIVVPGNPSEQFGSSHAGAPLILALEKAVSELGIPTVRFDYPGCGMNAKGGQTDDPSKWVVPGDETARESLHDVVTWARQAICKRVVLIGYSYGASHSLLEGLNSKEGIYAYVAVSFGYNVFKFFPEPMFTYMKMEMERHSDVTIPCLYLCGEADRMTPQVELKRLVDARKDGGAGVTVELIKNGKHDFKGQERETAQAMKPWLEQLRDGVAKDVLN